MLQPAFATNSTKARLKPIAGVCKLQCTQPPDHWAIRVHTAALDAEWTIGDRVGWHDRRSAVGFNMSWMFVDQVDLNELYAALDV